MAELVLMGEAVEECCIQDPKNAKEGKYGNRRGLQPLTFKAQGKQGQAKVKFFVTDALSEGKMEWEASVNNSLIHSVLPNCGPRLL